VDSLRPDAAFGAGHHRANEPWFHNGSNVMPHMPDRAEVLHRTVLADPDWWSANVERIAPRYAQWMAATDPGN